jgi:RNA polymerase sigma factor (sigma-70 family)
MTLALLTRSEEAALGRRVQAGLSAATELGSCTDADRRRDLNATVRRGRRAEDEFVRRNVGLVHSIAAWYVGRGLDLDDLRQAGFIGLLTAVRKFDPERGLKLSTMATYWIRQSVRRELENLGSSIRLPSYRHQQLNDRPDLRELLRRASAHLSASTTSHSVICSCPTRSRPRSRSFELTLSPS